MFEFFCCFVKAFTALNKVWTRVKGPISGLLLLLSVCPLLSDNSKAKSEVNGAKTFFKESSFQPNSVSSYKVATLFPLSSGKPC